MLSLEELEECHYEGNTKRRVEKSVLDLDGEDVGRGQTLQAIYNSMFWLNH